MFQLLTFDFLLSNLQPYYIVNSFSSFDADGHAHDDLQVRRFKVPDSSASSSVAALIKLSFIASTSWLTLRIFKAFSSNSNARASRFRLHSAYFLLCFKFILPAPFSPSFFECFIFPILQFLGFSALSEFLSLHAFTAECLKICMKNTVTKVTVTMSADQGTCAHTHKFLPTSNMRSADQGTWAHTHKFLPTSDMRSAVSAHVASSCLRPTWGQQIRERERTHKSSPR